MNEFFFLCKFSFGILLIIRNFSIIHVLLETHTFHQVIGWFGIFVTVTGQFVWEKKQKLVYFLDAEDAMQAVFVCCVKKWYWKNTSWLLHAHKRHTHTHTLADWVAALTLLIRRCREKSTLDCLDTPQQLAHIDLAKRREADTEERLRSDNTAEKPMQTRNFIAAKIKRVTKW